MLIPMHCFSNFVPIAWKLHNPYCHNFKPTKYIFLFSSLVHFRQGKASNSFALSTKNQGAPDKLSIPCNKLPCLMFSVVKNLVKVDLWTNIWDHSILLTMRKNTNVVHAVKALITVKAFKITKCTYWRKTLQMQILFCLFC